MQPLVFHVFVDFGFCCWGFAVLVEGGMLLNWGALCLLEFVVCLCAVYRLFCIVVFACLLLYC